MKLERFKEKNNKKRSIIVFTICCILLIVGVFFYQSFALFETRENFNFVEGNVEDPGDLYFAYYIDDVLTYDMPSKDSGYTMSSKSNCTNGVTITWDDERWGAFVDYTNYTKGNNSRVKCNLYFEEKKIPPNPTDAVKEYIIAKALEGTIIEDDGTSDHNLRYIGANPNNYVSFNNELWRIIGVMNNIDDGTGNKESRIKIKRNESIGEYSWDTSDSSINYGYGINEWSQADVMKLLNPGYESEAVGGSLYWNRESGTCYNGYKNATTACDFSVSGLNENSKRFIENAIWNVGANGETVWNTIKADKYYELEHSNNIGKVLCSGQYAGNIYCNDTVERTTTWNGKVGFMSVSDYGYATNNESNSNDRLNCLAKALYEWQMNNSYNYCNLNNWLFKSDISQWTMIPAATEARAYNVFRVGNSNIRVGGSYAYDPVKVFPVLYLKSNVIITSGEGTMDSPFELILG